MATDTKTIWTPSEEWEMRDFGGVVGYKPSELLSRTGHNIVLYGKGGAGKTTTASSAKHSRYGRRLLWLNAEGNAHVLAHDPGIKVQPIFDWKQIDSFNKEGRSTKSDEFPFDVVVFDNLSEMRELNMRVYCKTPGEEQIQHWRTNTADILNTVRIWRDITRRAPVSVVFIAWEEQEKNDAGAIIGDRLMFNPALQNALPGIVDNVGRITVESDARTRKLSFVPNRSDCKLSVAHSEPAAQIPLELYYTDQPVLADVLNTVIGGDDFPRDLYRKPQRA